MTMGFTQFKSSPVLPILILNSNTYSRTVQGAFAPMRTPAASVQTQKSGCAAPDASKGSGCAWMQLDVFGGQPYLENALCSYTHTQSAEILWKTPQNTKKVEGKCQSKV